MHILFIVNPISGLGLGKELPEKIRRIPEYDSIPYDIVFTEYAGHARKLVEDARQEGKYTHIVAVGGDGTVNEVGGALCGSDVAFGRFSGEWQWFCPAFGLFGFYDQGIETGTDRSIRSNRCVGDEWQVFAECQWGRIRCRGGP